MSEPDKKLKEADLKRALAENGTLDPEKGERQKKKAVDVFSARMRRVERLVWVWLILCVCVGLFAFLRFQSPSTTSTKALIGYAILLLIAYESTILLKLAYWILNVKLSLLKEIKLLRLEGSHPENRDASMRGRDLEAPLRSIAPWERIAWKLVMVAIVVLTMVYVTPEVHRAVWGHEARPELTHQGYVTLAADGSGTTVTVTSSTNKGVVPIVSSPFECGSQSANRWIDDRGRELPVTVSTENGRSRYTIRFIDPVMPGQPNTYKRVTDDPVLASKEGDLWTCRADWGFGPQTYKYTETVKLPEGAEIVSVSPEPAKRFVRGNAPVLRIEASLRRDEHFKYIIRYRVPPKAADQEGTQSGG